MTYHGISLDGADLHQLCMKHGIRKLYVFGSILRDDFGPASDVDFLVRLEEGARPTLRGLIDLEDELSVMVGRSVDVVLGSEIDAPDANPYRKREILATMEPVYGEG